MYFGILYYTYIYDPIRDRYLKWKYRKERKDVFQKYVVNVQPAKLPQHRTEIWLDNTLINVYYGQDAIDVELGKIPVPHGAKLKTVDY
jgi:hypothetical protein